MILTILVVFPIEDLLACVGIEVGNNLQDRMTHMS